MNTSKEQQRPRGETLLQEHSLISDISLISRIRNGDAGLFEVLMRRYNNRVYRVARSLCTDDDEAMDVVQESWIKIYWALSDFQGPDGFPSWATKITYNNALMRLRKQKRIHYLAELGDIAVNSTNSDRHNEDPLSQLAQSQLKQLLEGAIDRLPVIYRAVFVLRAVQHLSTRETAASLNLTPDTVKQRFSRARRILRSDLESAIQSAGLSLYEFDGARCDYIVQRVMSQLL
ncbi:RNA polymerase sigma factor [Seongchinamella sediminis]|uniref:RNA polymerase sigma factor n=1 Tax=Seongchinamella sediminis TaxID=2283635 RepID=UPI0013C2D40E|nr:RNA polymerase sigma factor [Seongchinamella sediminis]